MDKSHDRKRFANIRRLEIKTARLVQGAVSGNYLSTFKGRGIEFNEVREYVEGDDVRAIDWNVTARMGTPYVKTFVEERDLTVMLAVDVSPSMGFGTRAGLKSDAATQFAATVASLALMNNDRVGLVAFSDRVHAFVPPAKGRRQAVRALAALEDAAVSVHEKGVGRSSSPAGLIMNTLKTRATVFWVSDFIGVESPAMFRGLSRRHEFVPVVVYDRREREMPDVGMVELYDPETGESGIYDTSSTRFRDAVRAYGESERGRLEGMFRSLRSMPVELETGIPPVIPLGGYFRRVMALRGR